jgi:hypothetical protein
MAGVSPYPPDTQTPRPQEEGQGVRVVGTGRPGSMKDRAGPRPDRNPEAWSLPILRLR